MPTPDINSLNDSLKSIATLNERTVQLLEAQVRASERLNRASKDTGRELDGWHTEMRTLLRDTAEIQAAMERIKKLQKAQVATGSGKSGTLEYVRQVKQEYAYLMKTLTAGQHNKKYVKDVNKLLTDMSNIMKVIEKRSDSTWDSSEEGLKGINRQLREANKGVMALKQNIDRVKVDRMSTSFKRLGATIDEAFSGDASRFMRQIPGVSGFLNVKRFGNRAAGAKENIEAFNRRRIEQRQAAARGNAQLFADKFGAPGVRAFRKMGYAGESPLPKYHRAVKTRTAGVPSEEGAAGSTTKKSGAAFLWDASGTGKIALGGSGSSTPGRRTITVPKGLLGRSKWGLGKVAPAELTGALGEGAGSSAFNRWALNQAKGTGAFKGIAGSLLTKGGGSAAAGLGESVVGASSGIMSGAFGAASKAAPWVAVAKGVMDVMDRVAIEHAKIQEVLGPYGARGTGNAHDEFSAVRNSLLSTGNGNATFLGQGLKENMDIMRVIGEGGMATGNTLRSGKMNLKGNLEMMSGQEGNGFYGSIMKNAVYNGKNLGMNQESSVQLTMKLMEKFGKTTLATQEFFRDLDVMMEASGVSASKYIEIADGITDQFDDMNKSLSHTMGLLNNLGKTSRFTGKQMEEMIKTIEAKNAMNPAQMVVNAQTLINSGETQHMASAEEASAEAALKDLKTSLDDAGIEIGEGGIMKNVNDIAFQIGRSKSLNQQDKLSLSGTLSSTVDKVNASQSRAAGYRSNDPGRIAGILMATGTSGNTNAYQKLASMYNIAKSAGMSKDVLDGIMRGDPEALQKMLNSPKGLPTALINQSGSFQGEFEFVETANKFRDSRQAGALHLVSMAEGMTPETLLEGKGGGKNAYNAILRAQRSRAQAGNYKFKEGAGAERAAVDDFIRQAQDDKGARELAQQLQANDDTFRQMLDENSPLSKSIKTSTEQVKATLKAEQTISATRTMADTFADSFQHLFNRLIISLDKIARFINRGMWEKEANAVNSKEHRGKLQDFKEAYYKINPKELTEVQKARYKKFGQNLASGVYMDASGGPEQLAKDLPLMRDMALSKEDQEEKARLAALAGGGHNKKTWDAIKKLPPDLWATDARLKSFTDEMVRSASGATPGEQWESIKHQTEAMQATGDVRVSDRGGLEGLTPRGNSFLGHLYDSIGDTKDYQRSTGNTGNVIINQYYGLTSLAHPFIPSKAASSPQAPIVEASARGRNKK